MLYLPVEINVVLQVTVNHFRKLLNAWKVFSFYVSVKQLPVIIQIFMSFPFVRSVSLVFFEVSFQGLTLADWSEKLL